MMTVNLSHLSKLSTYLAAQRAKLDSHGVHEQLQALQDTLVGLHTKYAEAESEYQRAYDELKRLTNERRAEFEAVEQKFRIMVLPDPIAGWEECAVRSETDPNHRYYRPDRAAAYADYQRAKAEYHALRYRCADASALKSSAAEVQRVEHQIVDLEREIARVESAAKQATEKLPNDLLSIDDATLSELAGLSIGDLTLPSEPEFALPVRAGIIRGEIEYECDCDAGYINVPVTVGGTQFMLHLDDDVRHHLCYLRTQFDMRWLDGTVPPKHAAHRLADLGVWERSPIPERDQEIAMSLIPSVPYDLPGWLMLGPPGTSKTTYAAAAITDWLTFRMIDSREYMDNSWDRKTPGEMVNYWRVKAPQWIRQMEAYETRDFGDRSVAEPFVAVEKIERATTQSGRPPILWLEELDKIPSTTKNRLRNLYCLIDVVYEAGGTIVSTANERADALEKMLGEPIYRRLSGKNDPKDDYVVIDYYDLAERRKKEQKKRKEGPDTR